MDLDGLSPCRPVEHKCHVQCWRFAALFGFKTWSASTPCPRCRVSNKDMYNFDNVSLAGLGWTDFDAAAWRAEVQGQLKKCVLTSDADLRLLLDGVQMKFCVKKPFPGRVVTQDFVFRGTEINNLDKLQVGGSVSDLGGLDKITNFPAEVYFFRRLGSHCNKVTPFWELPGFQGGILGLSIEHIEFDVLHTLDLGVVQSYIGLVVQSIVDDARDLLHAGILRHKSCEQLTGTSRHVVPCVLPNTGKFGVHMFAGASSIK